MFSVLFFFFQAEDGIRDLYTGVQTCALPISDDPLLSFEPYRHRAPRRNSITPERQRAFIAALAATGIVTQAARSKIGRASCRERAGDAGMAVKFEERTWSL